MEKIKRYLDHYTDSETYYSQLYKLNPPEEVLLAFTDCYHENIEDENVLDIVREYLVKKGYKEYVDKADKNYMTFMK